MKKNRGVLWLVGVVGGLLLLGWGGGWERGTAATAMGDSQQFLPVIAVGYPFGKSESSPQYLQNFANNAGCNWSGIAGEVLDVKLDPVAAGVYRVHVWDGGVDVRVMTGSNPAYGPSGWEVFLFDSPQVQEHNVQLESVKGTAVSPIYRVTTRASCEENLLLFTFVQSY